MQGGVKLVMEMHMHEFSGKERFPENGVQHLFYPFLVYDFWPLVNVPFPTIM